MRRVYIEKGCEDLVGRGKEDSGYSGNDLG